VGGQEEAGPGVEDGLVGEVDDLVGGETLETGEQRPRGDSPATKSFTP